MRRSFLCGVILCFLVCLAASAKAPPSPPTSSTKTKPDTKIPIPSAPVITSVNLDYEGGPSCEVDIGGQNFGSARGSRTVIVDGTPVTDATKYINWSNTSITIKSSGMPTLILWDHEYKFVIGHGSNPISGEFKVRFKIPFDEISPSAAPPNSKVEARGLLSVANKSDKILKLGSATIPSNNIISWTSTILQFRVPVLTPGTYDFYIMKGILVISEKIKFTVL